MEIIHVTNVFLYPRSHNQIQFKETPLSAPIQQPEHKRSNFRVSKIRITHKTHSSLTIKKTKNLLWRRRLLSSSARSTSRDEISEENREIIPTRGLHQGKRSSMREALESREGLRRGSARARSVKKRSYLKSNWDDQVVFSKAVSCSRRRDLRSDATAIDAIAKAGGRLLANGKE